MTKKEIDEVLTYVAQNLISPLYKENLRPAREVWEEMIGEPFNNFSKFMHEKLDK